MASNNIVQLGASMRQCATSIMEHTRVISKTALALETVGKAFGRYSGGTKGAGAGKKRPGEDEVDENVQRLAATLPKCGLTRSEVILVCKMLGESINQSINQSINPRITDC